MSNISNCLSTIIQPSDELARQFTGYLLGAITDHSDILIISPEDGLIKIQDDLNVAITLLDITFAEAIYIRYTLEYDLDSEELQFTPTNQFTELLADKMRELE